MDLPSESKFENRGAQPPEPRPTRDSDKIAKRIIKRQMTLLDHANACLPYQLQEREFIEMFSSLIRVLQSQRKFRCLAVDPPQVDMQCRVTLHNELPSLVNGRYISSQMGEYGDYLVPGVYPGFVGMVVNTKGVLFGEPTGPQNEHVLADNLKARPPKGILMPEARR
jgi:hypothetical protein